MTEYLLDSPSESDPYRGCGRKMPAHGWTTGRLERDHGFAAAGTGNDGYALGFYNGTDVARPRRTRPSLHRRRPLLLVAAGRDVSEPPVHARRDIARHEDEPASRSTPGSTAATRSGTGSQTAGVDRALLLRRSPVPRALRRPPVRSDLADRRLLRRRGEGNVAQRRDGRPRVPGAAPHRQPPARRHPHGAALPQQRVRRRSRDHRSGRARCSSSPTTNGADSSTTSRRRCWPTTARARTTPTTSGRAASACRRSSRHRSRGVASSTTRRTTTRRSCGSSSGASSARRRRDGRAATDVGT